MYVVEQVKELGVYIRNCPPAGAELRKVRAVLRW
jgi:hypothetical protein